MQAGGDWFDPSTVHQDHRTLTTERLIKNFLICSLGVETAKRADGCIESLRSRRKDAQEADAPHVVSRTVDMVTCLPQRAYQTRTRSSMDRAVVFETKGCRFDSYRVCHKLFWDGSFVDRALPHQKLRTSGIGVLGCTRALGA